MNVKHLRYSGSGLCRNILGRDRSIAKMATPSAFVSHLEVERKFLPTAGLKACLYGTDKQTKRLDPCRSETLVRGGAPFPLSFFRLPDKLIRDTYYDVGATLADKGVWIRQRNTRAARSDDFPLIHLENASTKWEAKVRLAGDYVDSQFVELESEPSIRSLLKGQLPNTELEDLDITADLETHRSTWIVIQAPGVEASDCKAEFRIDLDEISAPAAKLSTPGGFKHYVGELEMTAEVVGGQNEAEHSEVRKSAAESMHKSIGDFMMKYRALFPCSPKPKGKLGAYFEWKEKVSGSEKKE